MNRLKKMFQSKRENEDPCINDSADDIPDEAHDRFVEDIRQFHGKPKINPATRNEPAAEVSEFHFQPKKKTDKGKALFRKDDLLRPLRKKEPKLAQKLESVKKTSALPKPLETVHQKKIQRVIGFEKARKELDRWDDVVQTNRVADQLHFPLKNRKIEVFDHTDDDLFSSFSNQTPLEKELAAILNSSDVAKEDKEKMEQSKFRLTLKEMIEKRKMMAKVRAQASYKVSKARRQNKIKSKKYHRLLRNEKTKQQIKDFEILQKTDPEAALKQLEMLEKSRAEERATLRHRNTGKWARNQIIKAKYNKESRIALSEQLSKNRELTQKSKTNNSDDDSASEIDAVVDSSNMVHDSNNPWIADSSEYGQFVSNYKKFWEQKTEETECNHKGSQDEIEVASGTLDSKENEETLPESNEKKDGFSRTPTAESAVEKRNKSKVSKKSRKSKKKSVGSEQRECDEIVDTSDKRELVEEIKTSSGCWTVTESNIQQKDTKTVKPKKNKKKSSEFSVSSTVNEMFKSLEDNISRKLKRKFSEVQKSDSEKIEEEKKTENTNTEKKKRKKRKSKSESAPEKHTDQDANTNSNLNESEKLASTKFSSKKETHRDIDVNKFLKVTTKRLQTEIPDIITTGEENIDDDEKNDNNYRITIGEAFAEDDVVAEFEEEKAQVVANSQPKMIDPSLPGWGSWTGSKISSEEKPGKIKRPRINKRLLFKAPKVPPRKDANKGLVVINEEKTNKMKEHLVSDLPHPFTHVKDYEATIRAPVGRTWIPETAHQQLVAPPVVTKLGTVIEPMDEGELIDRGDV